MVCGISQYYYLTWCDWWRHIVWPTTHHCKSVYITYRKRVNCTKWYYYYIKWYIDKVVYLIFSVEYLCPRTTIKPSVSPTVLAAAFMPPQRLPYRWWYGISVSMESASAEALQGRWSRVISVSLSLLSFYLSLHIFNIN